MSKLFSIGLEVEEVAVGRVLRQLDGMAGVAKINLNLTGQRRSEIADEAEAAPVKALAAPVKQRQYHKTKDVRGTLPQAVADALKDGELNTRQIGSFLQRRGFSTNSIGSTLNRMSNNHHIQRGNGGFSFWQLTSVGMKQYFGGQKNHSPALNKSNNRGINWMGRGPDNSKGIRRLVLDFLRDGPKPSAEVTKVLIDNGKSAKSMTGPVYSMRMEQPALIAVNNGMYSITPHGKAEVDKIIRAEQSQQSSQPQSQAAE